ncbi:MAG TPA: Maf family protein [Planctomycetota bacterium]|nr:Maf family protein [Planctomycetota bacterium]
MRLYLASTSPRRRDLLAAARIPFECVPPGDEPDGAGPPAEVAMRRAASKCVGARVPEGAPAGIVLGVDTVVDLDGVELGKPRDRAEARAMLRALAGRVHAVHTAHCVRRHPGTGVAARELTTARVAIAALDAVAIEAYLDEDEWQDKAGAYGIQGAAGRFCTLVDGELDTVIGLSVAAVRRLLAAAGSGPP